MQKTTRLTKRRPVSQKRHPATMRESEKLGTDGPWQMVTDCHAKDDSARKNRPVPDNSSYKITARDNLSYKMSWQGKKY